MNKCLIALTVMAVGTVGSTAALAEIEGVPGSLESQISTKGLGRPPLVLVQRAFPAKIEPDPVNRPRSFDPTNPAGGDSARATTPKAGPIASASEFSAGSVMNLSGGMLTPRGAAMSSPRQRAERAIARVIRRLD